MNILINFSTLKTGGGQNVAMNFLYAVFNIDDLNYNLFYFVAQNSLPHKFLQERNYKYYHVVPNNPLKRILFELFHSKKILEKWSIDIIYSYFGFGLFPKKYKQIVGSADSNLFFPEIDFWKEYKGINRLKKYLIDYYRIYGIKSANAVVFENSILEERGKKLFKLKNTITIKPSINVINSDKEFIFKQELLNKNIPRGLFLCGWHLNKNILKIPKIAYYLKSNNFPFQFILTAPLDNSYIHKQFNILVEKYNVKDMCLVVGQVNKEELASLYQKIDYVFLLSKLESFSNNIIEAWYFKKPLIISKEEWSRNICEKAALYVDRDNSMQIAKKIMFLSKKKKDRVVTYGIKKLNEYPSTRERIFQEMEFVENVFKNN